MLGAGYETWTARSQACRAVRMCAASAVTMTNPPLAQMSTSAAVCIQLGAHLDGCAAELQVPRLRRFPCETTT